MSVELKSLANDTLQVDLPKTGFGMSGSTPPFEFPTPAPTRLNRNLLIELAERALYRHTFLTEDTIRCLFVDEMIRRVVLNRLARYRHLAFHDTYILLSERFIKEKDTGHRLYINCTERNGLRLLRFLVEAVLQVHDTFITDVMLDQMNHIDQRYLLETLALLRSITHLTFPADFSLFFGEDEPLCRKIIDCNAETLRVLRYLPNPSAVPMVMRHRIIAVNHFALYRYTTTMQEVEYQSYYTAEEDIPPEKSFGHFVLPTSRESEAKAALALPGGAQRPFAIRISLHRATKLFDSFRKTFLPGKITHLYIDLLYTFSKSSIDNILNQLVKWKEIFPRLEYVELNFQIMESDPRDDFEVYDEDIEDENAIVPQSIGYLAELRLHCEQWLMQHAELPFKCHIRVVLKIEYNCSPSENLEEFENKLRLTLETSVSGITLTHNSENRTAPDLYWRKQIDKRRIIELGFVFYIFRFLESTTESEKDEDGLQYDKSLDKLIQAYYFSII